MSGWGAYHGGYGRVAAALVVVMVCLLAFVNVAKTVEAQSKDPRYAVYVRRAFGYFPDPAEAGPRTFATEPLAEAVETYFRVHDLRFRTLQTSAIYGAGLEAQRSSSRSPSPSAEGVSATLLYFKLEEAKGKFADAAQAFARYDLATARALFEEVVGIYERYLVTVFNPAALARVYENLGLVYAELSEDDDRVVEAFGRMLRMDSTRVITTPFFPAPIADMYATARRNLLSSRSGGPDAADREILTTLGDLVDADVVVWGYVVQSESEFELVLQVFRRDSGDFLAAEHIALTGDPGIDIERASRLASRVAACIEPLPVPPPSAPDRERRHFYLDSSFAYMVYLNGPTREFFDNYGFSLAGSLMLSDNFALNLRVNLLTSSEDVNGDLLTEFSSIRSFAGAGFSLRLLSRLRPFMNFSIEGSKVGDFTSTTNFWCKVNANSPSCDGGDLQDNEPGWLLGVNLQAGIAVQVYSDFGAYVAGNGSFYAVPLSGREIDLPVGFDSGLEYRF